MENIFKFLEVETKENIHSSFIASVINASAFAKQKFVEMLNEECKNKIPDYTTLKASTEKVLSSDKLARVDIYLSDYEKKGKRGNTRIIIENKIFAGDQKNQLKKYHDHLQLYENNALFYLTIEGKDASYYSKTNLNISNGDYYLLNYSDHIMRWLKEVKENKGITPKIKTYVEDYLAIIEELSAYNSLLNTGFIENKNLERYKFDTLLELRFWQGLETEVLKIIEDKYSIDYKYRYYSYSKIIKTRNLNARGKGPRDYGIILKKNEKDKSPDFRISVKKISNNEKHSRNEILLSLKCGKFQDDKWEDCKLENASKDNANHKSYHNIVNLADLEKTGDFVEPINKIVSMLDELIKPIPAEYNLKV
jgi:hypothetical protein